VAGVGSGARSSLWPRLDRYYESSLVMPGCLPPASVRISRDRISRYRMAA
jgi:hypothetical protein